MEKLKSLCTIYLQKHVLMPTVFQALFGAVGRNKFLAIVLRVSLRRLNPST